MLSHPHSHTATHLSLRFSWPNPTNRKFRPKCQIRQNIDKFQFSIQIQLERPKIYWPTWPPAIGQLASLFVAFPVVFEPDWPPASWPPIRLAGRPTGAPNRGYGPSEGGTETEAYSPTQADGLGGTIGGVRSWDLGLRSSDQGPTHP